MLKLFVALSLAFFGVVTMDAQTRMITDAAGRKVEIPDKIARVLPAGPPASILVYVLAPDKLTVWVRAPSDEEKAYLLPSVRDLPAYGRLTGKGGTANMKAVLAARPDIILDVGTVDATYASLADKVQAETGIRYVLIDGSFTKSGETLRLVGEMLDVEERAKQLAEYSDTAIEKLNDKLGAIPTDRRPKVYLGEVRKSWRPASPGR